MTARLLLADPVCPWLDAISLTKLLLSGDKVLTATLQQNVTDVRQYYHADPVLDVWQWPKLALTSFPRIKRVSLVTSTVSTIAEPTQQFTLKYHPLYRVDLRDLPNTLEHLVLKFDKVELYSWEGVQLPGLLTAELAPSTSFLPIHGYDKMMTPNISPEISSKLVNMVIHQKHNSISGINKLLVDMNPSTAINLHFVETGSHANRFLSLNHGILQLDVIQHFQLTTLSMKCVLPVITLFGLPPTLTSLTCVRCNVLGHHAIPTLPLKTLMLDNNIWYEPDTEADGTGNADFDDDNLGKVKMCTADTITMVCPPTILTVSHCQDNGQIRPVIIHIPHSVTDLRYESKITTLTFYGTQDDELTSLRNLNANLDTSNNEKLLDLLKLIGRAPNLRAVELYAPTYETVRLVIDTISQRCRQLEKLKLPVWSQNFSRYQPRELYLPQLSMVECDTSSMVYLNDLLITTVYSNLRVLSITVNLSTLTSFNHVLQTLRLERLKLQLTYHEINDRQVLGLAAPSSLIDLSINIVNNHVGKKVIVLKFTQGVPPQLRSVFLNGFSSAFSWIYDDDQVEYLPTTLEWCHPLPQSTTAQRRLHNLLLLPV